MLGDLQTETVRTAAAAGQRRRGLHRSEQFRGADARRHEVLFPAQQIARRREQAAVAHQAVEADGDREAVLSPDVAGRAVPHDDRRIVMKERLRHAQGFEDVGFGERGQRLAAHARDDLAEQQVAAVVVDIVAARRKS